MLSVWLVSCLWLFAGCNPGSDDFQNNGEKQSPSETKDRPSPENEVEETAGEDEYIADIGPRPSEDSEDLVGYGLTCGRLARDQDQVSYRCQLDASFPPQETIEWRVEAAPRTQVAMTPGESQDQRSVRLQFSGAKPSFVLRDALGARIYVNDRDRSGHILQQSLSPAQQEEESEFLAQLETPNTSFYRDCQARVAAAVSLMTFLQSRAGRNLECLEAHQYLTYVKVLEAQGVSNLDFGTYLQEYGVQSLRCEECPITTFQPLGTSVVEVYVSGGNLASINVGGMTSLRSISLVSSNVTSADWFMEAPQATTLNLDFNRVSSIFQLSKHPNLTNFQMKDNPLGNGVVRDQDTCPIDGNLTIRDWCLGGGER